MIKPEELKKYLKETLAIEISFRKWNEQKKLPFFILDAYEFFETSLLTSPCLFMISKDENERTPGEIQTHWKTVAKKWNATCVYISNSISSYNRQRLIQHHIPFIVPKNQMYIPDFGLDLREHFRQQRIEKQIFSPATQTVIISFLLSDKNKPLIPSELAARLKYSPMTMTRVFNELEVAGIGKIVNRGKERLWIFEESKKTFWEKTNSMLRSPIKKQEAMKLLPGCKMPDLPLSGISALAETTLINPPSLPVYAMGLEKHRQTDVPKGMHTSNIDEANLILQIWHYNPELFSDERKVDPFSLYLSLKETKDERVEEALEELMEKIKW